MSLDTCREFGEAIEDVVNTFSKNHLITYGEIIGCLEILKHKLCIDAFDDDGEEKYLFEGETK